jgi:hypothetical protein
MKVKELITLLKEVEDQEKYIHLLGNIHNGEDEEQDIIFNNIEIWDDGEESITLFLNILNKNQILNYKIHNS